MFTKYHIRPSPSLRLTAGRTLLPSSNQEADDLCPPTLRPFLGNKSHLREGDSKYHLCSHSPAIWHGVPYLPCQDSLICPSLTEFFTRNPIWAKHSFLLAGWVIFKIVISFEQDHPAQSAVMVRSKNISNYTAYNRENSLHNNTFGLQSYYNSGKPCFKHILKEFELLSRKEIAMEINKSTRGSILEGRRWLENWKVLAIFISNNWEKQGLLYPEISWKVDNYWNSYKLQCYFSHAPPKKLYRQWSLIEEDQEVYVMGISKFILNWKKYWQWQTGIMLSFTM